MNNLYYAEINDIINTDKFEQLLSFLSREKSEKIKQLRFDIDKKLSLLSEILVRILICKTLNISNSKIIFGMNKYGKPYLKNYPNIHFNLSHTRSAIIVVICDKPAGIDIEKIREADIKIAKRFFTQGEVTYITKAEGKVKKHFYEVWTKKETYIKYVGKGLAMLLNSFDVLDDNISKHILTFEKGDYMISVCGKITNAKCVLLELTETNIENNAIEFLTITTRRIL